MLARCARTLRLAALVLCAAACSSKDSGDRFEFRVLDTYDPADPVAADRLVLSHLEEAGADLSKATHVVHYIYFPTRQRADAALAALPGAYSGAVDVAAGGDQHLLKVEHDIVPSIENIGGARRDLEKLALEHGGEYDGWEAAVTK